MAGEWWEPPCDALDTRMLGAADLNTLPYGYERMACVSHNRVMLLMRRRTASGPRPTAPHEQQAGTMSIEFMQAAAQSAG